MPKYKILKRGTSRLPAEFRKMVDTGQADVQKVIGDNQWMEPGDEAVILTIVNNRFLKGKI